MCPLCPQLSSSPVDWLSTATTFPPPGLPIRSCSLLAVMLYSVPSYPTTSFHTTPEYLAFLRDQGGLSSPSGR